MTADATFTSVFEALWNYRVPETKSVRIRLWWTQDADESVTDLGPWSVARAREVLHQHGLELACTPASARPGPEHRIAWSGSASASDLDAIAERVRRSDGPEPYIHVVFLRLADKRDRGVTRMPGVCFVDADGVAADGITMLHEIGHAMGCQHLAASVGDKYRSIMSYAPDRNRLTKDQVAIFLASPYVE